MTIMDVLKNTIVFITLLCINGILSQTDVVFDVAEGVVGNLPGTTGVTVRSNTPMKLRCSYVTVTNIAAHNFQKSSKKDSFFNYIHQASAVAAGTKNPEIKDPFFNPLRITQVDSNGLAGIVIDPVELSDADTYKCQVIKTDFTQLTSNDVKINVVAIPRKPTLSATPGTLVEGQQLTVTCTANVGEPKGSVAWYRQLASQNARVPIQKNNSLPDTKNTDGTTSITETYIVDVLSYLDNGAKFTCEARNPALGSNEGSLVSDVLTVNVNYNVRDIKVSSTEEPHYPGHKFKCEANSNPAPGYKWTKVNGTQTLKLDGNNILEIPEDAKEELLYYKCEAFNTPGSSEVRISYILAVNITVPPTTTTTTTPSTTPMPTTQPTPKPPGPATGGTVNAGMIGGIVGALIAIIIIVIIIICVWRHKKGKNVENVERGEKNPKAGANNANPPIGGYDVDMDDNFNNAEDPKKKNLEGLVYADLNFDDRPRSRKPIQIQEDFDRTDYADIRRV